MLIFELSSFVARSAAPFAWDSAMVTVPSARSAKRIGSVGLKPNSPGFSPFYESGGVLSSF